MFILIRDRINKLSPETFDVRQLTNYVKILNDLTAIKCQESFMANNVYNNSLKIFNDYLAEQHECSIKYFIQCKQKILNVMVGLLHELEKKFDITTIKDYKPNFNDESNLYLLGYEIDHEKFFEINGSFNEQYLVFNKSITFTPKCKLTEGMKTDIKEQIEYLAGKYQ